MQDLCNAYSLFTSSGQSVEFRYEWEISDVWTWSLQLTRTEETNIHSALFSVCTKMTFFEWKVRRKLSCSFPSVVLSTPRWELELTWPDSPGTRVTATLSCLTPSYQMEWKIKFGTEKQSRKIGDKLFIASSESRNNYRNVKG